MEFNIITLFPKLIESYLEYGIVSRAVSQGLVSVKTVNLRDYAVNKYGQIDHSVFGTGKGMLFRAEPLDQAIQAIRKVNPNCRVIYLTPQGKPFTNLVAKRLAGGAEDIVLISARYEGIDARIVNTLVDEEISIGDFVLTGGELPALAVIDAVTRFLEGSIKAESANDDSFENGLLEYDHYTEPLEYKGMVVPEELRTGNHREIEKFRFRSGLRKTYYNRPELLMDYRLEFRVGQTANPLKRLQRENETLTEYLNDIEKITKEWKDVRRNQE